MLIHFFSLTHQRTVLNQPKEPEEEKKILSSVTVLLAKLTVVPDDEAELLVVPLRQFSLEEKSHPDLSTSFQKNPRIKQLIDWIKKQNKTKQNIPDGLNGAAGGVGAGRGRCAEKVGEVAVVFGMSSLIEVEHAVAIFGEFAQETASPDPNIGAVLDGSRLEKEIGSGRDVVAHLAAIARLLGPESVGAAGEERVWRGGNPDVGFAVRFQSGTADIPTAHGTQIDAPSRR